MVIDAVEYIEKSREERRTHLRLEESCCERGGNSTNHRGVLAEYLGTTIPKGRILLCHACNNSKCSNPRHLYWGTDLDNLVLDKVQAGTFKNPWQNQLDKYGEEELHRLKSLRCRGNKNGSGNKGKPKSEEQRRKISESLRNRRIDINP